MKNFLALIILTFSFGSNLNAQLIKSRISMDPKFKVSALGGFTLPYTDVQSSEMGYTFGLGAAYLPLQYLELELDIQKGILQEGFQSPSPLGVNYRNEFLNTTAMVRFLPFQMLDRKNEVLRKYVNISLGAGISFFKSDVDALKTTNASLGYVGDYNEFDLMFPLELGYSLPVYSFYTGQQIFMGASYRYFLSTTDKLDGYQPVVGSNTSKDIFTQVNFSISYAF